MQPSLRLPLPIRPPDGFFSQDVLDQVAISAFIDRRAFRRAAFAHPASSFALATSLMSAGMLPKNVFQPDVAAAISAHFRNYA
jgi:hypothetical protein